MKRRRSLSTNRQSFLRSSLWKNYRTSTQGTKITPTLKSPLPVGADQKWQQEPKVAWPSAVLWKRGGSRQEADAGGGASGGEHPDRALPGLFSGFGHLQHSAGFLRDGPKTEGQRAA